MILSKKQTDGKMSDSPYLWTFSTYFAEGFPYIIIRNISSLFFRDRGATLKSIGLTSLFGLAWILKPLFGPLADRFGTKRSWMLWMQAILCLMMLATALLSPFAGGLRIIAALFFAGSFIAATNDIAIDGYYLEALDAKGQQKFIGYRVMAYRVAMIAGTGVVATVGTKLGWFTGFLSATALFGLFFLYNLFFLPRAEKAVRPLYHLIKSFFKVKIVVVTACICLMILGIKKFFGTSFYAGIIDAAPALKKLDIAHIITVLLFLSLLVLIVVRKKILALMIRDPDSFYSKAFLSFIDRDKIGVILMGIIFLRTGEFMLSIMETSFFIDLGIKTDYGWIKSFVGLPCSIAGALIGGAMISKKGLKKVMWPFLLLQNCTNLLYMSLAFFLTHFIIINTAAATVQPIGMLNLSAVVLVHGFDQFSGGLGTAVLTALLIKLCNPDYKAAHFAIGTGLMSLSGVFMGIIGGILCDWLGYGYYFGISFIFSIPGMAAICFLPDALYKNIIKR